MITPAVGKAALACPPLSDFYPQATLNIAMMMMRLYFYIMLLGLLAPVAAMTKADLIEGLADATGVSPEEATKVLQLFFDLTTSKRGDSALVQFGSYSLSKQPRNPSKKKPKEIVVVGSNITVGTGVLFEDCTFQLQLDLPFILTHNEWPITLRMKVRASIKKRGDVSECVDADPATYALLRRGIDLEIYLPTGSLALPEVDDEVLVMDLDLPLTSIIQTDGVEDGEDFDENLGNFALFLPTLFPSEVCVGATTAAELGMRGVDLTQSSSATAFIRQFVAAGYSPKKSRTIARIIQANLASMDESTSRVGFGAVSISKRAARTGRNPQTGATIRVPKQTTVVFKAGSGFSEGQAE